MLEINLADTLPDVSFVLHRPHSISNNKVKVTEI